MTLGLPRRDPGPRVSGVSRADWSCGSTQRLGAGCGSSGLRRGGDRLRRQRCGDAAEFAVVDQRNVLDCLDSNDRRPAIKQSPASRSGESSGQPSRARSAGLRLRSRSASPIFRRRPDQARIGVLRVHALHHHLLGCRRLRALGAGHCAKPRGCQRGPARPVPRRAVDLLPTAGRRVEADNRHRRRRSLPWSSARTRVRRVGLAYPCCLLGQWRLGQQPPRGEHGQGAGLPPG